MEVNVDTSKSKCKDKSYSDEIACNKRNLKRKYTFKKLSKELANKPHILKFILYLQKCLRKRKKALKKTTDKLERLISAKPKTKSISIQTEKDLETNDSSWNINNEQNSVSLVDQVKEAAENALQQTGMVYEETSGMYYDYNTGYYYNANTGLYYHSTTGCYYYYDKEKNSFSFHSQADINDFPSIQSDVDKKHSKKSKSKGKVKKEKQQNEDGLPENISQIKDKISLRKRTVCDETESNTKKKKRPILDCDRTDSPSSTDESKNRKEVFRNDPLDLESDGTATVNDEYHKFDSTDSNVNKSDGECSASGDDSCSSDSNDSITSRYPPCIRIIVSETSLTKLKVGSLFILTKEGGTLGREGDKHAIIIPEENISKHHLTFTYDEERSSYYVKDVGSRNGTIFNGTRMSASKIESDLFQVVHASTLQIGNTKLLCHIHKGNNTCGHCEPGLLIKDNEPAQKIYKPINLKALHRKELYRLKEKYKVKPDKNNSNEEVVLPEGYEDKAQMRRETVGSTHDAVKTEQASLETTISSENKGFKLLQKMGWSMGDGLGKTAQGTTEPVPLLSNKGTSGLGAANLAVPSASIQMSIRRQGIWLAAQKRYDKASTSSIFNIEESDDEVEGEKK